MKTYVIDTNIISYLLKGMYDIDKKIHNEILNGSIIIITPITYYEINRGLYYINANNKIQAFNEFYNLFGISEITISKFITVPDTKYNEYNKISSN